MRGRNLVLAAGVAAALAADAGAEDGRAVSARVEFSLRSVRDGTWSDAATWEPARRPRAGDRVLVSRGTRVVYDAASEEVIRLLHVAGTLTFAADRDTRLEVGILKVQKGGECSESGFACDIHGALATGEPGVPAEGERPVLEVGTAERPIAAEHTARIRLHHLTGMDPKDAPAVVCCSARMDLHGAPLSRTWVKLGSDVKPGDATVVLAEEVSGWRPGDEVIVTGSQHNGHLQTFRAGKRGSQEAETEPRRIAAIEGTTIRLDRPLAKAHSGSGEFRSEVANLSRNVSIESADPDGVRGHTLYHRFSRGSVSYVRFAHLGKEGVLGRYPLHFHLAGDTMRGTSVVGAAIVDSHNRWITVHGTRYLLVRDCVGYRSVGHGFFLEDGTEVWNVLDRNLGVHAFRGKALRDQALPFDPNDGAAFWWANGRNTLVRNVSCENDEYGFRYDSQSTSDFDSRLEVVTPDGGRQAVDIRTLPVYRFEANEAHTEGLYGMVFAGNNQAGSPLGGRRELERVDRTGPDRRHPHVLRGLKIWEVHYGLRPQIPAMLIADVVIERAAYGIYRPMFEDQVYRNIRIARTDTEPFNRGMDDASTQYGRVAVDGLIFEGFENSSMPLIQMTDNDATGRAEIHFRGVRLVGRRDDGRRALVDRGGGARVEPVTPTGVPAYFHDWFGPGRHAKVLLAGAPNLPADGGYRKEPLLTGAESRVQEVADVEFPTPLDPVDDLPPATIITSARVEGESVILRGVAHDNGELESVMVNGVPAKVLAVNAGVADWEATIARPADGKLSARSADRAGNVERTAHELTLEAPAAPGPGKRRVRRL
jgi:hypothetical protein